MEARVFKGTTAVTIFRRFLIVLMVSLFSLPSRAEMPERIGPFSIQSEDGRYRLKVGLIAQLQMRADSRELGPAKGHETTVQYLARRIRPSLRGNALSKDLGFYLHLSTAPGSLEFMDWYLDFRFHPDFRLRGGQFKIPFTRYRIQSFKNLTLVDWSMMSKYFGAERQMGVALHNGYEKPPAWAYELGLFTGTNARAANANGLAKVYGEPMGNPSDLVDPAPIPGIHPELVAHLAYNHGGIDVSTDTDFAGGGFRFSGGLSATWDLKPDVVQDFTARLAAEVLLKFRGASLAAMAYLGWTPHIVPGDAGPHLGVVGAQAQVSYQLFRVVEFSARYAFITLSDGLRHGALIRSQALIAAAPDDETRQALTKQYQGVGDLRQDHEIAAGINLYLIGRSLKWQNDVTWRVRTLEMESRVDITFRTQMQLAF